MARALRRVLLLLAVLGVVATAMHLLLIEHDADPWQVVPLGLLAVTLPAPLAWMLAAPGPAALRLSG